MSDNGQTPMKTNIRKRLTLPQREIRLCKKLVTLGMAYEYPHEGFSITKAGEQALKEPI